LWRNYKRHTFLGDKNSFIVGENNRTWRARKKEYETCLQKKHFTKKAIIQKKSQRKTISTNETEAIINAK